MRRCLILMLMAAGTWGNSANGQPMSNDRYGPSSGGAVPPARAFETTPDNQPRPLSETANQQPSQPQQQPAATQNMGPTYPGTNQTQPLATPPATTAAPAGPAATTPSAIEPGLAEELMEAALRRPRLSKLEGSPISLREVVATATSRAEQTNRVNAYWDLCSATSDYYLSLHEQAELEKVANNTGGNSPVLRAALQKLRTRLDTALTAAKASQAQLATQMGRPDSAPLPGDRPLCVAYRPKFEANFPNRPPQEAVELNRLLPLRYAELLDASANVSQSEQYFNQVIRGALQNLSGAETEIVRALELLALHRRAFVQIARDYNRRITRYTELANPGTVGSERLVAMLVKSDGRATAQSAPESSRYDGHRSEIAPAPTFRDDWQPTREDLPPHPGDEGVAPAAFEQQNAQGRVLPSEASVLGNSPQ